MSLTKKACRVDMVYKSHALGHDLRSFWNMKKHFVNIGLLCEHCNNITGTYLNLIYAAGNVDNTGMWLLLFVKTVDKACMREEGCQIVGHTMTFPIWVLYLVCEGQMLNEVDVICFLRPKAASSS